MMHLLSVDATVVQQKQKTLCSPYEMNAAVQQWSQAAYKPITQPVLLSQMHGGTLQWNSV